MVGIAASEDFITTRIGDEEWGDKWLITELGIEMKRELDETLQEIFTTNTAD
jgi:hypothetical protein